MELYPEKLILLRKKSGLTVKHITEQVDIGRSTYWNWENGMRTPSEKHTREVAKLLNINVNEISDLVEAVKIKEDLLFGGDTNWEQLTNDRGKELANKQKIALSMIETTTGELNKVWSIVQAMMESLDTILYIKDIESKYILANSSFRNNLGLQPSYKVSGKEDIDFYSKNEAKAVYHEDQKVIDTGEAVHHKVSIIPGSRKKKWGLISKHPIYDHKGKVSGLVCSYDDITEMKKLQRFRTLLEAVIKHSHDIFAIREVGEKNHLYVSEAISERFGYSHDKFIGDEGFNNFLNIIHPDYVEKEKEYRKNDFYPDLRQYQLYKASGKLAWVENSISRIMHEGKEYFCGLTRDITAQKDADKEIDELCSIIKSLDNLAIWRAEINKDGIFTFTFVSDNIEKIIGYTKEDVLSKKNKLFSMIHPEHFMLFEDWLNKKDYPLKVDHKIVCADKTVKWMETNIFPIRKPNGCLTVTATHTDITDRKTLEFDIIESQSRIVKNNEEKIKKAIAEKLKKEGMSPEKIVEIIG
jgi:PAS domain S-box-containing protein